MNQRNHSAQLEEIVKILRSAKGSLAVDEILPALPLHCEKRTLLRRLAKLVQSGDVVREGRARATRYRVKTAPPPVDDANSSDMGQAINTSPSKTGPGNLWADADVSPIVMSAAGAEIAVAVRRPLSSRLPVSYRRDLLDSYVPNRTYYLPEKTRNNLMKLGLPQGAIEPAGTYARKILDRLLIDLAFHSSRLEGNTYSLLETKRLIELGRVASGHDAEESQMLLNHKAAIEFLVESATSLSIDRRTILNLHALLAENLLGDPAAGGRLRKSPVAIGGSSYLPLAIPQTIEECFHQIALVASQIEDPFEQSFFMLVHLPYLQPFEDVNKRVSRLVANIPLIRANLRPLSFIDVPRDDYTAAILGVYELGKTDLLRDVFVWAYERSAQRYAAIRDSLGSPDPFRLRWRTQIKEVVSEIVRSRAPASKALELARNWTQRHIPADDRARFIAVVEAELVGIHEGNFARYAVTPAQYEAWLAADEQE